MSVDGGKTWIDASAGVMADPNVLVGSTVLYRVVVTNDSEPYDANGRSGDRHGRTVAIHVRRLGDIQPRSWGHHHL